MSETFTDAQVRALLSAAYDKGYEVGFQAGERSGKSSMMYTLDAEHNDCRKTIKRLRQRIYKLSQRRTEITDSTPQISWTAGQS